MADFVRLLKSLRVVILPILAAHSARACGWAANGSPDGDCDGVIRFLAILRELRLKPVVLFAKILSAPFEPLQLRKVITWSLQILKF